MSTRYGQPDTRNRVPPRGSPSAVILRFAQDDNLYNVVSDDIWTIDTSYSPFPTVFRSVPRGTDRIDALRFRDDNLIEVYDETDRATACNFCFPSFWMQH